LFRGGGRAEPFNQLGEAGIHAIEKNCRRQSTPFVVHGKTGLYHRQREKRKGKIFVARGKKGKNQKEMEVLVRGGESGGF